MKLHGNAKTCLHSRRLLVGRIEREGWTLTEAAAAAGVSVRTASKWVARHREEGEAGLLDRPSAPLRVPRRTPEERVQTIALLRRLRLTGAEIAALLSMPSSTVSAVLTRIGLGRLSALEPAEPANRYEKAHAGARPAIVLAEKRPFLDSEGVHVRVSVDGIQDTEIEKEHDGLVPWGANNDAAALRQFPADLGWGSVSSATWVDWWGWWGRGDLPEVVESPAALRANDNFHRPDDEIKCSERYTDPFTTNCPPSRPLAVGVAPATRGAAPCQSWSGPYVAALACDPHVLRASLRTASLDEPGAVAFSGSAVSRRTADSARGIAQVVGAPFAPTARIVVRGRIRPTTVIALRVQKGRQVFVAKFRGLRTKATRATIRFGNKKRPQTIRLVTPDGRTFRPRAVLRVGPVR